MQYEQHRYTKMVFCVAKVLYNARLFNIAQSTSCFDFFAVTATLYLLAVNVIQRIIPIKA